MSKLFVASTNQGKIREIKDRFQHLHLEILSPDDVENPAEVLEDGNSFRENALKKARVQAQQTGYITLADDSGLVVEYLGGRPGIYSARFAGENASDEENNNLLLQKMEGVSGEDRRAYFKCAAALVLPDPDEEISVCGICEGYIIDEKRGTGGFGYDPVFYLPKLKKTMAEISAEQKNQISHRAQALDKLEKYIKLAVKQ